MFPLAAVVACQHELDRSRPPIGIPSGWEEIAAWFYGRRTKHLTDTPLKRWVLGTLTNLSELGTYPHYDWRVEE